MYAKKVVILGTGDEFHREVASHLEPHYTVTNVTFNNGEPIYEGRVVKPEFFIHRGDVLIDLTERDKNIAFTDNLRHEMPIVSPYMNDGLHGSPARKLSWKKHVMAKSLKTPQSLYLRGESASDEFIREQFVKILLPVSVHGAGDHPHHPIYSFNEFREAILSSLAKHGYAYIESYVPGDRVHVIVIPHLRDNPDYAISIPLNTDHTIRKILEKQSADLHHELGLGNLSQFDFIVNKKIPHLLDINPNPDIKQGSVMIKGTEKMGINMAEFWKHVIERARKEFKKKRQN